MLNITIDTSKPLQICSRCVLDTTEPTISFDTEGVCNYCRELEKKPKDTRTASEKKKDLDNHIEQIRQTGKNKDYDCIIGLSGGVDSSYVAYLVKQAGLRPLAVHFDNGWNSELAVSNIENVCKRLDIDLYTYVVDWTEFKDIQTAFLKASVANAETPTDHAIVAALYRLAAKNGVKYIVDGVNSATEGDRTNFTASGYSYADLKQLKGIHQLFGSVKMKTFPTLGLFKRLYYSYVRGIKRFSILNYVDYDKNKAIEFMSQDLGWRSYGSKHHESLFTKFHQTIYLPHKFNFDKRKLHLSDMILSGQITRQEALIELQKPYISDLEKNDLEYYLMKKLDLSPEEYHKILNAPPVSFRQYPNYEWILNGYTRLKQRLSNLALLKNIS